jgi:hypothetical protein
MPPTPGQTKPFLLLMSELQQRSTSAVSDFFLRVAIFTP